ncbi:MAG: hypothetical protein R3F21_12460 [Myxococcota bacterium]
MTPSQTPGRPWILPDFAAEEGGDWRAYPREPSARIAARLLGLLFAPAARLLHPGRDGAWIAEPVHAPWPSDLGPPPDRAVLPWLDPSPEAFAWLNTRTLADAVARGLPGQPVGRLAGAEPACIEAIADKRFALDCARSLGLHSPALDPLIEVIEPAECLRVDETIARLEAALAAWPDWTGRRYTLKPRLGSSGRGRTGGAGSVDAPAVRGALVHLARRGGAIFEPWLERTRDLSVSLRQGRGAAHPEILASFELLTSRSGLFRGHCGVIEANGQIVSGDPEDARLRAGAVAVARRAADRGFFGLCGIDAFRHREGEREAWRGAVELNPRPTMGFVTFGLVLRALASGRAATRSGAGQPSAFLFTLLGAAGRTTDGSVASSAASTPGDAADPAASRAEAILARAGAGVQMLELTPDRAADEPRAVLYLGPDRAALREACRSVTGC